MALQLDYTYKGITANYHKIISASENYKGNTTDVVVGVYKDKAARDEDVKNFLKKDRYHLDGVDKTRDEVYAEIKVLDEYSGAEDA